MKYIVSMYSSTGIQKELGLGNGPLKEGFWNFPGIPVMVHSLRAGLHSGKAILEIIAVSLRTPAIIYVRKGCDFNDDFREFIHSCFHKLW